MNTRNLTRAVGGSVLAVAILIGTWSSGVLRAHGHDHAPHRPPAEKPATPKHSTAEVTLRMIHAQQLPALQKAILSAARQVESGNSQAALAELKRAQDMLEGLQKTLEQQVKPRFANARCPIMGAPIQAANVPLSLTRSFEGQKVAFCCASCPNAWDRLSHPEKAAKLAAATGQPKHE
jgi:hypothetical protein